MSLVISCGVGQQPVTGAVLESPAGMVSMNRTQGGWFDYSPGVPAQIREIKAEGKNVYLRMLFGVWCGDGILDRAETINIVWQGKSYRWPLPWKAFYLGRVEQFLENRVRPLIVDGTLGAGDVLAVDAWGVESAECYWPLEALAMPTPPTIVEARHTFTSCAAIFAKLMRPVDPEAPPYQVKLAVNCSKILGDEWAASILPDLRLNADLYGNNVLTGDPAQPEDSQHWICKSVWGLPGRLGTIGGYFHQKLCPDGMTQEEHLLGMIAKCQDWGVEVLELNETLCLMFPEIVEAAQA